MMTSLWTRNLQRAALGGMLGIVVLAVYAPGTARAQDSEPDSIWNLDRRVFKGFMNGIGLRDGTESTIEYRERSPLVVPPNRNLPPPQANAKAPNPAWPKDPDAQRKEVKRKTAAMPDSSIERNASILLPSALDPFGTTASVPSKPRGGGSTTTMSPDAGNIASPSQLGYFGGLSEMFSLQGLGFGVGAPKEEVGVFTNEPPRTNLTAPPVGYQTPSAAQPYGVVNRPEYAKPVKTEELTVDGKRR
jgi:hypothetical protein